MKEEKNECKIQKKKQKIHVKRAWRKKEKIIGN